MKATTVDESMPPDSKAPSGTSAHMRRLTASASCESSSSIASVGEPPNGWESPLVAASRSDQYDSALGNGNLGSETANT
jgi:hypothetical protein